MGTTRQATADANRTGVAYQVEDAFGVVANTGNELFTALRFTGESIKHAVGTVVSEEIRADRQTVDYIRTNVNAEGDVNVEMSAKTFDDWFLYMLLAAEWVSSGAAAQTNLAIDEAPVVSNVITRGDLGDWATDGFAVGDIISIAGYASPENNGYFTITDISGTALTVSGKLAMVDEATMPATTFIKVHPNPISLSDVSVAAGGVYTSAAGDFSTAFSAGDMVSISGFVNAENNGVFTVVSAVVGVLTVTPAKTDTVVESAPATPTAYAGGSSIQNGVTFWSLTFQKYFLDIEEYDLYTGMAINTFNMNLATEAVCTGTFGFLGRRGEPNVIGAVGSVPPAISAPSTEVWDPIEDIYLIINDETAYPSTAFTLALNNNLRALLELGQLGAISMGTGSVEVTGTVTAYFRDKAAYEKYLAYDTVSLEAQFQDSAGNAYSIKLPACKLTDGQILVTGRNTDALVELTFGAFRDQVSDSTIQITRFQA